MKIILRIALSTLLVGAIFSTACKKKPTTTPVETYVDIPYYKDRNTDSITPLPLSLWIKDVLKDTFATNLDYYLSPYGVAKSDITRVEVLSLNAQIDNVNPQTFDIIEDSIQIMVDKYQGTSPTKAAYKYGIPLNLKYLEFDVNKANLKDYFMNEFMQVDIQFKTRPNEALRHNTHFITNMKFRVYFLKK